MTDQKPPYPSVVQRRTTTCGGRLSFALLACLALAACEKDPARSVKIVERPPTTTTTVPAATQTPPHAGADANRPPAGAPGGSAAQSAPPAEFRLEGCPPLAENGAAGSNFTVDGPCAFRQRGAVSCEALADDFIIVATRKARNGGTVMIYVNVEQYAGPGSYKQAQMFVGVQDKVNIWRWSSDAVDITVGAKEAFAEVPATRLEAEPVLINCTGPMTNYQCEGRDDQPAFERTVETASGRLQCEPRSDTPRPGTGQRVPDRN
jgi:hypothetical protein